MGGMRDLKSGLKSTLILAAVVKNSDTNCTGVDTKGYGATLLSVNLGASADTLNGSNTIQLELEESDDNSSYSDCADASIQTAVTGSNTGTFAVIDASGEDSSLYTVGYIGNKRYVRVVLNFTGTHSTGTPIGVAAHQYFALAEPV